jgi:uncharacterized protein (DUF1919 family)
MKKVIKIIIANVKKYYLRNKNFSIISDNCWGGFVYQNYNINYKSPFVGLFIFSPDYLKLLKNLREYMDLPLRFIEAEKSSYKEQLVEYNTLNTYPIAKLGDIEIHFLHYKNEEEANKKWNRRKARIDYDNLIVKFCDRDLATEALIEQFFLLNFDRKVCLTASKYDHPSNLKLKCEDGNQIEDEWKSFKRTVMTTTYINNFYN